MGLGSGIRDLGLGKNLFRIPYPGIKKTPDPGSATLRDYFSPLIYFVRLRPVLYYCTIAV
jgi:hypothetical protein